MLEDLCTRIFSFRFVNISFVSDIIFVCVCVCVGARSLTKSFFRLSQPGSCTWLSPFLLCDDCTCILMSNTKSNNTCKHWQCDLDCLRRTPTRRQTVRCLCTPHRRMIFGKGRTSLRVQPRLSCVLYQGVLRIQPRLSCVLCQGRRGLGDCGC